VAAARLQLVLTLLTFRSLSETFIRGSRNINNVRIIGCVLVNFYYITFTNQLNLFIDAVLRFYEVAVRHAEHLGRRRTFDVISLSESTTVGLGDELQRKVKLNVPPLLKSDAAHTALPCEN